MATVTDINIHAIPVYDGQSRSGLNPAQQGSNRSENFGQTLSESSSQYHKNNKEQWVKKEAADSSTVEPAPAAVTETSAAAASNRGEAQQRAINRQAEAASVATESSSGRDERARQDLPVEGNALPKQAVTGRLSAESSSSQQSLQALNRAKTQGSALTTQINQPQSALKLVEQSPTGAAIDPGDLDDGLAALLGRQAGLKAGPQADFSRSPLINLAQANSTPDGNRAQPVIAAQPVQAAEGAISRQDASALSAILAMPGLAEQAGKAPPAHSALAAAVVTQDRAADLDRRLRLQAPSMGGRAASNALTTDARPSNTTLSWQTPDGFADLLKKSASTTSQVTQISASMPTGQGLNAAQSGGAPVLPTLLLDGNAMGGAFKLPSGFEISGGTAQGQMVTPFSQPAWAQELAQQAKFMVRDQLQFVELKLKPANLGSVEIVLKQDDDQTTLMFFAKNPAVREALEASLQKLQKSFDDDGLQLQQTVVSDQSLSEHRQQAASEAEQDQANGLNGAGASGDQSDITDQQAKLLIPANDQLLDLWA
jgi:flagellar hook-length control protein FliK